MQKHVYRGSIKIISKSNSQMMTTFSPVLEKAFFSLSPSCFLSILSFFSLLSFFLSFSDSTMDLTPFPAFEHQSTKRPFGS